MELELGLMYNIIHGINNIPQRDDKDVITSRILLFYFWEMLSTVYI